MPVNQDSWDARLARAVGQNVRQLRQVRETPLSALALSERTTALGHPVHRSVIAKLENGERASVTLADLFVLARALNVPPFALITPLTTPELVEVLPGKFMTAWDAIGWFNGDSNNVSDAVTQADADFEEWYHVTDAYQMRWRYEVEVLRYWEAVKAAIEAKGRVDHQILVEKVASQRQLLEQLRRTLDALGVTHLPGLIDPTREIANGGAS